MRLKTHLDGSSRPTLRRPRLMVRASLHVVAQKPDLERTVPEAVEDGGLAPDRALERRVAAENDHAPAREAFERAPHRGVERVEIGGLEALAVGWIGGEGHDRPAGLERRSEER